jgi:hypothetical protein
MPFALFLISSISCQPCHCFTDTVVPRIVSIIYQSSKLTNNLQSSWSFSLQFEEPQPEVLQAMASILFHKQHILAAVIIVLTVAAISAFSNNTIFIHFESLCLVTFEVTAIPEFSRCLGLGLWKFHLRWKNPSKCHTPYHYWSWTPVGAH